MGSGPSVYVPQDVRSYNYPANVRNKLKRLICGDPVKATLTKMSSAPDDIQIQEDGCEKLTRLAKGSYYNSLVGDYGGLSLVLKVIMKFSSDQLAMYKVLDALTIFAENGPNTAKLRDLKAERVVGDLRKLYIKDSFMADDCDKFFARLAATGVKLASEYVEDAVTEEDTPKLLELCHLYRDLPEVVDKSMRQLELLLIREEHCMGQMAERASLNLLIELCSECKTNHMVVYRCLSICHILSEDDGLSLELGKVGAVRLMLDLIRERKSGRHAEHLQLALFVLCRLCLVEPNAVVFHKLYGEVPCAEITSRIDSDRYEYPIVFPLRLKHCISQREEILDRDELHRQAVVPERVAQVKEVQVLEKETLVQSLILRREPHVIRTKKAQAAWEFEGVDFDPLSMTAVEYQRAMEVAKLKRQARQSGKRVSVAEPSVELRPIMVGYVPDPEVEAEEEAKEAEKLREEKLKERAKRKARRGSIQGSAIGSQQQETKRITESVLDSLANSNSDSESESESEDDGDTV